MINPVDWLRIAAALSGTGALGTALADMLFPGWQSLVETTTGLGDKPPEPVQLDPNLVVLAGAGAAAVVGVTYLATRRSRKVYIERWDNQIPPRRGLSKLIAEAGKNKKVNQLLAMLGLGGLLLGTQLLPKTTGVTPPDKGGDDKVFKPYVPTYVPGRVLPLAMGGAGISEPYGDPSITASGDAFELPFGVPTYGAFGIEAVAPGEVTLGGLVGAPAHAAKPKG